MYSFRDNLRRFIISHPVYPYVQLARWDRPVGWHLLAWPCIWSLLLAAHSLKEIEIFSWFELIKYVFLCIIGAIAMRGAGCTWNDIVDQDIDSKVFRTKSRPLPSGKCSRFQAFIFLLLQLLIGFFILIQFNYFTIFLGCILLSIVVLYPFSKRFMKCPQIVLSLCFSGGIIIGWSSIYDSISFVTIFLYIGVMFWVIGYDTIYAYQDIEDDELIGLGSTARVFANNSKLWLFFLYGLFIFSLVVSFYLINVNIFAWIALLIVFCGLMKQIITLDISCPDSCLISFKDNDIYGMWLCFGLIISLITC
ncbi:4-hydroxybenzoate octaprenyltransferase [Candidatus Liberibacter americanus]|uniref:4-hydroxybenzoate octaprenyltransferase n=1 Tax=Candidatus Liberibacter americanus str. Sao Paulo TaxID=1261131 RepID=U6B7U5_9HYPH|nr:4-hydroxybenzoate octaprenyltransferase [Candidatus Liberibacter americanus]AHA27797.1 4-hydroxybenzoate polyprenyltransferase [Candidatus Liberibacter americanus str. Sao Paulo]EMS36180.1 prenyltransferase [Candidatus Liberibacter americanus PW_SP]